MNPITLSWEDWRAVIDLLRAKELSSMREHTDVIERLLDQHGDNELMVTLSRTDDVYLRSSNGVPIELGIPLPPMER